DKGVFSMNRLILTTPPDQLRAASAFGLPLAHISYRIGAGAHLFRAGTSTPPKGGLMVLADEGFDNQGNPQTFLNEVSRECNVRGFSGIVFDIESFPSPLLLRILASLETFCMRCNVPFYLPERYSQHSKTAILMVSSALSGGSLAQRLSDLINRYGAERIALCLDRIAEDFYLPAPQGSGRSLTQEELKNCLEKMSPSVFFSQELCAYYFTYMSRESGAHFVLFDNAGSLRQKITLGGQLGITHFFLCFPELSDILGDILKT
ncbi:MAG: hypothetical protein RR053_07170, partial [Evtepia sp.]